MPRSTLNTDDLRERFDHVVDMFEESKSETMRRRDRTVLLGDVMDRMSSPDPLMVDHLRRIRVVLGRQYENLTACNDELAEIDSQISTIEIKHAKGTPQNARRGVLGRLYDGAYLKVLFIILNMHFRRLEREITDTDRGISHILHEIEHYVQCAGLDGR